MMHTQNRKRCLCAVAVPAAASLAMAAGQPEAALRAEAVAVKSSVETPVFRADAFFVDEAVRPPMHPPLEMIPPLPMPNPEVDIPERLGGPGNAVFHDMITKETFEIPVQASGRSDGGTGPGFVGADGIAGYDDLLGPRGFIPMFALSDASISTHPFRMNVKLVQEYVDSITGNSSFFVCSGGMQDAEVVLTAGHCVYKRDNDSSGNDFGFADRIWVYPGWDGDGLTLGNPDVLDFYGWAVSSGLGTFTGWSQDGNFDWDMGLIRVTRAVGMLTGWYAWRWGGSCDTLFYNNPSFPSESCGQPGLHNGRDMYNWNGNFDSCPGNQMQIDTTPGCFTALWGGQSGSNVYDIDGDNRYAHGVASNSDRAFVGRYTKMWESFKNYLVDDFEPAARGTSFDIQSLQTRYAQSVITAGNQLTGGSAQMPNPTLANPGSATYGISVRLSTNNNISASDTDIGSGSYTFDYAAMQNVNLNMYNVTVPKNTPSGTYWVGVLLDDGVDSNNGNNDPDLWDAHQVTVNGIADIVANSCAAPSGTVYHGDTINVGYNVSNEGGDPSNAVTLEFYASTNTDISGFDRFLGSVNIGTFSGSQTKTGSVNLTVPSDITGTRYIGYIASASDDHIVDVNNEAYDPIALTVDGRADLRADYFNALDSAASLNGPLDIRFNVDNLGTVDSGAYDVDVYASTNTTITPSDTLLGSFTRASIVPGGTSTAVTSVTIPGSLTPGEYYIGMIVEPGRNEIVTNNNTAFHSTRVSISDCLVDFNNDGLLDLADIVFFVQGFQNQNPIVDLDNNGLWDLSDIVTFIDLFTAGCP